MTRQEASKRETIKNEHVCEHDRAEKYLFLYAAKEEKNLSFLWVMCPIFSNGTHCSQEMTHKHEK